VFDDRKVKYDVAYLTGDDVHLNVRTTTRGWSWVAVRVSARYDGVKYMVGEDHIYIYSRVDTTINWVDKYYTLLAESAKAALYAKLEAAADESGLDALIDPYEGDPRNEIADLADNFKFASAGFDWVYADCVGNGVAVKLAGRVERVLTMLRAAHGRAQTMTKDQAEAILLAEHVLQDVGCEGPDANKGGVWHTYVSEAAKVAADSPLLSELCNGLNILE
jgi:hypothetical protein